MNLLRLHQRYVADNTPLDDASQSDCEQALRQLLAADFPNPQPSWKQPRFLNSVLAGLDYCFRTSVIKKVRHFLCALHSSIQNYWILYYHSVH